MLEQLQAGTVVMWRTRGDSDDLSQGEPPFNGPGAVESISRSGNYIIRDLTTGDLLNLSIPIDHLKILDGIRVQKILGTRNNGQQVQVLFSNGSRVWLLKDSKILQVPIQKN